MRLFEGYFITMPFKSIAWRKENAGKENFDNLFFTVVPFRFYGHSVHELVRTNIMDEN